MRSIRSATGAASTRFRVNQTMGGGTWIYLGRFLFDAGCSPAGCVTLSNLSRKGGRIVTADGVKFGGGTGNVARIVPEAQRHPQIAYRYETSGYPRFTEGARYWLQWAGFADSVYTVTGNENDYRDDYMCRGIWVNALAGGSKNAPHRDGLRIPVDMSLAFHSDAGTTPGDSIIGTLGIYYSRADGGRFPNGVSREASRDLTDLVQSQIVSDIRAAFEPEWSRRGMWNASYFEARVPEVPAMLLELLSHQNFADMRYGLDPRFRFTVSRAIYKGILRYLSHQYRQPFVVQPLPVDRFRAEFTPEGRVALAWEPVIDTLEATAVPDRYVLYTRIGDGDFDNGVVVEGTSAVCDAVPRPYIQLPGDGAQPRRRKFPVRGPVRLPDARKPGNRACRERIRPGVGSAGFRVRFVGGILRCGRSRRALSRRHLLHR